MILRCPVHGSHTFSSVFLVWQVPHLACSGLELQVCVTSHVQVQAQVERLAALITAARAPTRDTTAPKQTPTKQAAASPAAASDGPGSGAGRKRASVDGIQRPPRKQQKQKHTKQSAVAA